MTSSKSRRSLAAQRVSIKTVSNSQGSQKLRQLIETAEEVNRRLLAKDRDRVIYRWKNTVRVAALSGSIFNNPHSSPCKESPKYALPEQSNLVENHIVVYPFFIFLEFATQTKRSYFFHHAYLTKDSTLNKREKSKK
jgi:hypothetical protein